jgi:hypothetical protein
MAAGERVGAGSAEAKEKDRIIIHANVMMTAAVVAFTAG